MDACRCVDKRVLIVAIGLVENGVAGGSGWAWVTSPLPVADARGYPGDGHGEGKKEAENEGRRSAVPSPPDGLGIPREPEGTSRRRER